MEKAEIAFVNLKPMHESLGSAMRQAIEGVMERELYINGPEVNSFESEFAAYQRIYHAVGVSNGLDALSLILRALKIGPGDEVILPANTFIATALAVSHVGATPVLVDVEESTFNLSARLVEPHVTSRTKAVIAVHLYGRISGMAEIKDLCARTGMALIEDAAQAHGAELGDKRAGAFGVAAAFSFYPGKNLGALGDGGAVGSNERALTDQVRLLANYGSSEKYVHLAKGENKRLDEIQAAVLRVKLAQLETWNEERRRLAAIYGEILADGGDLVCPERPAETRSHVWHLYVVRSKTRDKLRERLRRAGIHTAVHYPIPIHLQPAYDELKGLSGRFPTTEKLAGEILSLPLWIGLDVRPVAERIREIARVTVD